MGLNFYAPPASKALVSLVLLSLLSGCTGQELGGREKGALTGAALGAGLGAIVGNQTGHSGAGIAIGSAIGALSGGILGNEIDNIDAQVADKESRIAEQERQIQENQRLLNELRKRGADVRSTERGVVINLPDVLFEFDKAQLTEEARRTVADISAELRQLPERHISVEGHTDSVGTLVYNQRLSEGRARNVAEALLANGIPRKQVATVGYGETDPIASNSTPRGRQRNRRVEIIIEN